MANGTKSLEAFRRELAAEIFLKIVEIGIDEEQLENLPKASVVYAQAVTLELRAIEVDEKL